MNKNKSHGLLRIYTGGMGGGKTHQVISDSNQRLHNLDEKVLVIQPGVSVRTNLDEQGQTKARSSVAAESKIVPYDNPFEVLDLARETKLVTFVDSHMFVSGPIVAVVYGLLKSGIDVNLDCLKFDYGGKVFPVLADLIHSAEKISYYFRKCDCQKSGDRPQGFYNQLIVNTLFKKRQELLNLLKNKESPDQKLIYLIENGTIDKKTGLILPAYFGPTNITGDIAVNLRSDGQVSDNISYVTRCRKCFTKPRDLTEFLQ